MTHLNAIGTLTAGGYVDIVPADLDKLPEEVRLIDVREPQEFDGDLGHLDGAELVPVGGLVTAAADWDREVPLLLICRSGRRSVDGALALKQLGFTQLANLVGGMLAVRGAA